MQVDQFYQEFLHRASDPAGRAYWINLFLSGAGEADVAAGFLATGEYQALHQSDAAFVAGLYQDVLGRTSDATGLAFWQNALRNGASRADVALALLTSAESSQRVLDRFYAQFLGRGVDTTVTRFAVHRHVPFPARRRPQPSGAGSGADSASRGAAQGIEGLRVRARDGRRGQQGARDREGGHKGLSAKPIPGRPAKLSGSQLRQVYGWITEKTPRQLRFEFALWTRAMIRELIREHFPLTPKGIIDHLQLRRPIFKKTAACGHCGRTEDSFSWEKTDKADVLRHAGKAAAAVS